MAKELLSKQGKERSSGWTDLLRTAGLDFLPKGAAGRPSKEEVDQNIKAKQEALSIISRQVNRLYRGDWKRFLDTLKPASGGKDIFLQDETERLTEAYRRPRRPEEDEESENC